MKLLHNRQKTCKWSEAIDYAELKIMEHKQRIRALRKSIRVFKEQLEAGEPWPGSEKKSE